MVPPKVISMSIGSPFKIGNVSDAIKYAHSKGKMILVSKRYINFFYNLVWCYFPSKYVRALAATGLKEGKYKKYDVYHSGSKIDFTIQMQRTNGAKNEIFVLSYNNKLIILVARRLLLQQQ